MMRNNANASGNCILGCCVSVSLMTQVTKDSPTQRERGFHVEQRRAWWGNIKLVVLTKSAGKVKSMASLGSSVPMMLLFPKSLATNPSKYDCILQVETVS